MFGPKSNIFTNFILQIIFMTIKSELKQWELPLQIITSAVVVGICAIVVSGVDHAIRNTSLGQIKIGTKPVEVVTKDKELSEVDKRILAYKSLQTNLQQISILAKNKQTEQNRLEQIEKQKILAQNVEQALKILEKSQ